jgi:hypothetical protein
MGRAVEKQPFLFELAASDGALSVESHADGIRSRRPIMPLTHRQGGALAFA